MRINLGGLQLWFAFIFVSLSYWKHPCDCRTKLEKGCDLLSFLYLCLIGNTTTLKEDSTSVLWFAFIFVSLSYWKHQFLLSLNSIRCCDLLSFLYLCLIGNTIHQCCELIDEVVICFHFCIFVLLETPGRRNQRYIRRLWFAFIFVSLSYWKHHFKDLVLPSNVVICFHFCIFVLLETPT